MYVEVYIQVFCLRCPQILCQNKMFLQTLEVLLLDFHYTSPVMFRIHVYELTFSGGAGLASIDIKMAATSALPGHK